MKYLLILTLFLSSCKGFYYYKGTPQYEPGKFRNTKHTRVSGSTVWD